MYHSYLLTHWIWCGIDWLFPPICGGCSRTGSRFCPDCRNKVLPVPLPICQCCGLPISKKGLCFNCVDEQPSYVALRSWAVFDGPIRNAIHTLKYRRNLALGDVLAGNLALYARSLSWDVDLVVPVPLGNQRMKERGYNQVGLLARPFSQLMKWHYEPHSLRRVKETRSQVGLSMRERKENISDAFRAGPSLVNGKTVLVVDDVATSGATLAACSEALKIAGAKSVYGLTLARALPQYRL